LVDKTPSQWKKAGLGSAHLSSYLCGEEHMRIVLQAGQGINLDTISKLVNEERAMLMAQVEEHMLSKL
jgi:hypothetical protein